MGGMSSQVSGLQQQAAQTNAEWLDPRYVVVFAQDGDVLGSCKSFKMNLQEIIAKYDIKKPSYMKHETREHKEMKIAFQKRAYKELLEYCSDHILGQADEQDPTRRVAFKTMYTLDGNSIENLDMLKTYCEENGYLHQRKKVLIREDSQGINERAESPIEDGDSLKKVVS